MLPIERLLEPHELARLREHLAKLPRFRQDDCWNLIHEIIRKADLIGYAAGKAE